MSEYGKCALDAVKLIRSGYAVYPREAWEIASSKIFGRGTFSQIKGCPKDAFLGLCEEGLIKYIPAGSYTKSLKNKQYAIDAVSALGKNPDLASNWKALWRLASRSENKTHNGQMDVVISLWTNGLIE